MTDHSIIIDRLQKQCEIYRSQIMGMTMELSIIAELANKGDSANSTEKRIRQLARDILDTVTQERNTQKGM